MTEEKITLVSNRRDGCVFQSSGTNHARSLKKGKGEKLQQTLAMSVLGSGDTRCVFCGKVCSTPGSLRIHIRCHTGEKPFKCETCAAAFTNSSNLKRHYLSHTGVRKYFCGICGLGFIQNSDLKKHLKIHERNALQKN